MRFGRSPHYMVCANSRAHLGSLHDPDGYNITVPWERDVCIELITDVHLVVLETCARWLLFRGGMLTRVSGAVT